MTATATVRIEAQSWHTALGTIDGAEGHGRAVATQGGWSADWSMPDVPGSVLVSAQQWGETPADAIAAAWLSTP